MTAITAADPTTFAIRPARPEEADALHRLAIRSKAHWGYDADFMTLAAAALRIDPEAIAEQRLFVADDDGHPIGVGGIEALDDEPGAYQISHLFVDPDGFGRGVGRALLARLTDAAKALSATRLEILSDPQAEPFYRRMGAVLIGKAPSDAIPGRFLPVLEIRFDGPAMAIEDIADTEIDTVIDLWHAAGLTRPWNDPRQDIAFARDSTNAALLVGRIDDRIAASVMVGHDGHRGGVYYLAVDPDRRGHGLGRRMMTAAERWLLNRGVWKLNLNVRADNASVIGFYGSLGYADSGIVQMAKWIDPAKRGDA